jgi:hypothetical protein
MRPLCAPRGDAESARIAAAARMARHAIDPWLMAVTNILKPQAKTFAGPE